jgi:hypothetical protein
MVAEEQKHQILNRSRMILLRKTKSRRSAIEKHTALNREGEKRKATF